MSTIAVAVKLCRIFHPFSLLSSSLRSKSPPSLWNSVFGRISFIVTAVKLRGRHLNPSHFCQTLCGRHIFLPHFCQTLCVGDISSFLTSVSLCVRDTSSFLTSVKLCVGDTSSFLTSVKLCVWEISFFTSVKLLFWRYLILPHFCQSLCVGDTSSFRSAVRLYLVEDISTFTTSAKLCVGDTSSFLFSVKLSVWELPHPSSFLSNSLCGRYLIYPPTLSRSVCARYFILSHCFQTFRSEEDMLLFLVAVKLSLSVGEISRFNHCCQTHPFSLLSNSQHERLLILPRSVPSDTVCGTYLSRNLRKASCYGSCSSATSVW